MKMETVLFGRIEIPEKKEEILLDLEQSKKRFMYRDSRKLQYRIDLLEEALDKFRRLEEDV